MLADAVNFLILMSISLPIVLMHSIQWDVEFHQSVTPCVVRSSTLYVGFCYYR